MIFRDYCKLPGQALLILGLSAKYNIISIPVKDNIGTLNLAFRPGPNMKTLKYSAGHEKLFYHIMPSKNAIKLSYSMPKTFLFGSQKNFAYQG